MLLKSQNIGNDLQQIYNLQAERQVALLNILFEENQGLEIARQRELSAWELFSGFSMAAILTFAAQASKNRFYVIPAVPLVMWVGYRFESCFGQNASRIKEKAEQILKSKEEERAQLALVGPPITLHELDERRLKKYLNVTQTVEKLKIVE